MPGPPIAEAYRRLMDRYGPQGWWPARSRLEILIGAVLTQHTDWRNVEAAIAKMRSARMLNAKALLSAPPGRVEQLVLPAGPHRVKARRLLNLLRMIDQEFGGSFRRMGRVATPQLREKLLTVNGVGPETADAILLYAFGRPVFVVDAYTQRIVTRHGWLPSKSKSGPGYDAVQKLFEENLDSNTQTFNEYHALIVAVGKEHCRPKPRCEGCPLECLLPSGGAIG